MIELIREWLEPFKDFNEMARNEGFFVAFFWILFYVVFTLICLPFVFIWIALSFFNEKSKEFFK